MSGWGTFAGYDSAPAIIKIYDTQGNLIKDTRIQSYDYRGKVYFDYVAPAGTFIGEVTLTSKDPSSLGLDDLSWGKNITTHTSSISNNEIAPVVDDAYAVEESEDHPIANDENELIIQQNLGNIDLSDFIKIIEDDITLNTDSRLIINDAENKEIVLSDLLKDGTDLGDWLQVAGTITQGGQVYDVYRHSGVEGELLVQQGVKVELDNH